MILNTLILSILATISLCADGGNGIGMDFVAMDSDGDYQCILRGTVDTTGSADTATTANQLEPIYINFFDFNGADLEDVIKETKGNFVCSIEQTTSASTKLSLDGSQTGHCGNTTFTSSGEGLTDYKPWPEDSYKFNCTTKSNSDAMNEMVCDLELDGDSMWWLPRKDFSSKELWYRLHLEDHRSGQSFTKNSDGSLPLDRNDGGDYAKITFSQSASDPCGTLRDSAYLFSVFSSVFVLVSLF